jgi:hypothetical protein
MSNGFIKKTGQTAADAARKSARQIVREPVEILKTAVPQHLKESGEKDNSSLVAEMVTSGNKHPEEIVSEEVLDAQAKKRLEELEAEIEKIREERKIKENEWKESQEAMMQPEQIPSEKQFIEPSAKQKQGFRGFMKKKQGTKEMGKQMSG